MTTTTIDANGYQLDRDRGLRVCEACGLVMSVGYVSEEDGATVCSDTCLAASGWQYVYGVTEDGRINVQPVTPALIATFFEDAEDEATTLIYWTDWEGDDHSEEALERLESEPYNLDMEGLHEMGAHDDASDTECNYCNQLFDSTAEEAIAEAEGRGLDTL